MYCVLKYLEFPNLPKKNSLEGVSTPTLKSTSSEVAKSKNKQLLFNPNCVLQLVLNYIYEETQINPESDYDLCTEGGELLGIKDYKGTVNGLAVFVQKETYFLLIFKRGETGHGIEEITPLLDPDSKECIALEKNLKKHVLKKKSFITKRHSSSKHSIPVSHSSHNSLKTKSNSKRRSSAAI